MNPTEVVRIPFRRKQVQVFYISVGCNDLFEFVQKEIVNFSQKQYAMDHLKVFQIVLKTKLQLP
jgi:hypothetical protein